MMELFLTEIEGKQDNKKRKKTVRAKKLIVEICENLKCPAIKSVSYELRTLTTTTLLFSATEINETFHCSYRDNNNDYFMTLKRLISLS